MNPPVLTPQDHDFFVRHGYVVVKGAVAPRLVEEAVRFLEGGEFSGEVGAANYRALDGPPVQACLTPAVFAAMSELFGSRYTFEAGGACDMPRPFQPGAGWTSQSVHVDDDYPTLMPGSWALGLFLFLTRVRTHGGAFRCAPGSPWRYRAAGLEQPESLSLQAKVPELSGEAPEFLAEPGDLLLFHHLMGHAGTSNVSDPQTRHALLGRFHPRERIVPGREPFEEMTSIERANSLRWGYENGLCPAPPLEVGPEDAVDRALARGFGLGRRLVSHVPFRREGAVGFWFVEADSPRQLQRATSHDFAGWTRAQPLELDEELTNVLGFERDPGVCLWVSSGQTTQILTAQAPGEPLAQAARVPAVLCASGHFSTDYGSVRARGRIVFFATPQEPHQLRCCWGSDWERALQSAQNAPVAHLGDGWHIEEAWVKPVFGEANFALVVQAHSQGASGLFVARSPDSARFQGDLEPLEHSEGKAISQLRVCARARNFWLVSFARQAHDQGLSEGRLFWGTIDWEESPLQVREIRSARVLSQALSIVGWI